MVNIKQAVDSLQLGYQPRVVIGISARENILTPFAIQLMRLRMLYGDYIEDILFNFLQPVDLSRNTIFSEFLVNYPYATHLWILDTDVMVPDDAILRLLEGEKAGRMITSGLLVKKTAPYYPIANTKYGPNTYKPIIGWPQEAGLIDANTVGFGMVLIHRRVFQDIPYPFCATGNIGQSEDYSFFEKCIAYGYFPCLNTRLQCAHAGLYYYTFNDTQRFIGVEKQVAASVLNQELVKDTWKTGKKDQTPSATQK